MPFEAAQRALVTITVPVQHRPRAIEQAVAERALEAVAVGRPIGAPYRLAILNRVPGVVEPRTFVHGPIRIPTRHTPEHALAAQ